MKKRLYLMRHGQTLFNVRRKIQGACDSPLTPLGIQQALNASSYFDSIDLDHAYASTAERSSDTLDLILKGRMPYQRLKGLKEMNFGTFEGESEDLNPKHGSDIFEHFFVPYGGESRPQLRERMVETLTKIMEEDDHQSVLAISHAGASTTFLSHWHDPKTILKDGFPNCSILVFDYEDKRFECVDLIKPDLI